MLSRIIGSFAYHVVKPNASKLALDNPLYNEIVAKLVKRSLKSKNFEIYERFDTVNPPCCPLELAKSRVVMRTGYISQLHQNTSGITSTQIHYITIRPRLICKWRNVGCRNKVDEAT